MASIRKNKNRINKRISSFRGWKNNNTKRVWLIYQKIIAISKKLMKHKYMNIYIYIKYHFFFPGI